MNISRELLELFGICIITPLVFLGFLWLWIGIALIVGRLEEPAAPPSEWIPPEPYVPSKDLPQGRRRK